MRNAAAHFDEDYLSEGQSRKATSARKRGSSVKKRSSGKARASKKRYLHMAAIGLSASLVVGIMVNALVLQHSRHPAPLFGKAIQLGDAPAAALPAVTPPSAMPVPTLPAEQPPAPATVPAHSAAPAPVQRAHHPDASTTASAKPKQDDLIAKLLKTSAGAAVEKTPEKAAKDNPKTIMATQHALMKLGFVVKPDGSFGATTKSALEAFERDQHLPVKGEMSRKVLKQLSAESGMAID